MPAWVSLTVVGRGMQHVGYVGIVHLLNDCCLQHVNCLADFDIQWIVTSDRDLREVVGRCQNIVHRVRKMTKWHMETYRLLLLVRLLWRCLVHVWGCCSETRLRHGDSDRLRRPCQ